MRSGQAKPAAAPAFLRVRPNRWCYLWSGIPVLHGTEAGEGAFLGHLFARLHCRDVDRGVEGQHVIHVVRASSAGAGRPFRVCSIDQPSTLPVTNRSLFESTTTGASSASATSADFTTEPESGSTHCVDVTTTVSGVPPPAHPETTPTNPATTSASARRQRMPPL